jgi:hypothetical protein
MQRAPPTPTQPVPRTGSVARSDRMGMGPIPEIRHTRNGSSGTHPMSPAEYVEQSSPILARRHDYDVQSMEASLKSPRGPVANIIAPPIVTVRSEFPTLTRSRTQQSLTCLITVEVSEPAWRNETGPISAVPTLIGGSEYGSSLRSPPMPVIRPHSDGSQLESAEELERITAELHNRVENWHGLDLSRYVSNPLGPIYAA